MSLDSLPTTHAADLRRSQGPAPEPPAGMRVDAMPAQSRAALARTRLLEQLRGVQACGLGLVVAPTGFGKTTLLDQWAQARGGTVRWCDPADLPAPGALLPDAQVGSLRGVVIDDVPVAADPERTEQLERFIQAVAPLVPVLLAARRLPALNLARQEFANLCIVTERDLAFRHWEVAALFDEVYEDPLHRDEPLTVTDQTGGWAATLRLWHLARRMEDRAGNGQRPTALDALLRSYLNGQVLSAVRGASLRRTLRLSSVFDTVTAERLALLTKTKDSRRSLARIAQRVDLITVGVNPVDGPRYTWHPVVRNHLRSELLDELGPRALRQWYDRAADVADQVGDAGEAFAARCRAENAPEVAALLATHGASVVPGTFGTLQLLTPSLAVDQPMIGLARARLLLAEGRPREAHREAARARPLLLGSEEAECRTLAHRAATAAPPIVLDGGSAGARSLQLLALGRPREARHVLLRPTTASATDPVRLAAAGALAALDALVAPGTAAPDHDRVLDEVDRSGSGWLRRLAYIVALCRGGNPCRCAEARLVAAERDRLGDAWGSVLIECVVALALMRRGQSDAPLLERLCDRLRLLGSPTLEAWARSALALAVSGSDAPESQAATTAEAFARSAGAPGPLALAYAALGRADPVRRAEFLALANATAQTAGMSARPWTWTQVARPRVRPTTAAPRPSSDQRTPNSEAGAPAVGPRGVRPARQPAVWEGLTLTCFGTFTLSRGGHPETLSVRPIALTVLRILALHAGSPVHRDVFVEALWPDLPEQAAHHNLHVAVSSLRQGFEAILPDMSRRLLARQGQEYTFAPGPGAVTDLQRFDGRLAEATQARRAGDTTSQISALHAAIDLYVDDVLPGDGAAEWVLARRDGYRLAAADAAGRVAELELRRDHVESAITAAQRAVQIDPCRDGSWRTLVSAHLRAGEPAQAEQARQEYAAVLDSLGVRTLPEGRPAGVRIA